MTEVFKSIVLEVGSHILLAMCTSQMFSNNRFFTIIMVDHYRKRVADMSKRAVSHFHFLCHDSFQRWCNIKPMQRQMWKSFFSLPSALAFIPLSHPMPSLSPSPLLSVHLSKHQSVGDIRGLMWGIANAAIHSFMHGWGHSIVNAEQGPRVYPSAQPSGPPNKSHISFYIAFSDL